MDRYDSMTYTSSNGGTKNYVHRFNDSICIENCEVNSDISKYYHINGNNACYQSCKDYNNYLYEYYSTYYTNSNGFKVNFITKWNLE